MNAYTGRQHVTFPHQLTSWCMHISQYYSCYPDCYWYFYDYMCIASYGTANSDCLKGGGGACALCMRARWTTHIRCIYQSYIAHLLYSNWSALLFFMLFILASDWNSFTMLKSCWRWSCTSDEIRSSATYRYLFLNYIGLSIWSSYLSDYMSILSICSSYSHLIYLC